MLHRRIDQLEAELRKQLHNKAIDVHLIVEATQALIYLGYNPNEIYAEIVARGRIRDERTNHHEQP